MSVLACFKYLYSHKTDIVLHIYILTPVPAIWLKACVFWHTYFMMDCGKLHTLINVIVNENLSNLSKLFLTLHDHLIVFFTIVDKGNEVRFLIKCQ